MAIDPNIKKKADDIRNKIYGQEVRESLASGLEEMSSDVVETVGRQDEVESQFQDVIENTTDKDVISAPEIIAARDGEANLKARLDKEHQEVTAQSAQTDKRLNNFNLRTFPKFGPIDLAKFEGLQHNVNFDLWRDPADGVVKHNWKLIDTGYTNFYVTRSGSFGNDGKTAQTAWSTLASALQKIEADANVSKAIINLVAPIDRNVASVLTTTATLTKKYIIRSEKPIATNQHIASYSVHSGTTVKGTCPYPVLGVLRIDETDVKGLPVSFKKTVTVEDCIATPDSYFADGTNVYINRSDTTFENTYVLVNQQLLQFKLGENAEVVMDNFVLLSGSSNQSLYFEGTSAITGDVILNNVDLYNFGVGDLTNGVSTNAIKDIKSFDCRVFNIPRDGFNYHNTNSSGGTVFEYNCYAENVGTVGTAGNNNISTGHEGLHILRVGTKGRKSQGPMIADVNGCYSANIDVSVYDTGLTNMTTRVNSAFYFDDSLAVLPGKAWLVNCSGGGPTEFAVNGDDAFRAANKIFVDNFVGNNIPGDVYLTQFSM